MQRGELGEREAVEGREPFLCVKREWRWGENMGKTPPNPNAAGEKWKVETAAGTELKREK